MENAVLKIRDQLVAEMSELNIHINFVTFCLIRKRHRSLSFSILFFLSFYFLVCKKAKIHFENGIIWNLQKKSV